VSLPVTDILGERFGIETGWQFVCRPVNTVVGGSDVSPESVDRPKAIGCIVDG